MTFQELHQAYRKVGMLSPVTPSWRPCVIGGLIAGAASVVSPGIAAFALFGLGVVYVTLHRSDSYFVLWAHSSAWLYGPTRSKLVAGHLLRLVLESIVLGVTFASAHIALASNDVGQVDLRLAEPVHDVTFAAIAFVTLGTWASLVQGLLAWPAVPQSLRQSFSDDAGAARVVAAVLFLALTAGVLATLIHYFGLILGTLILAIVTGGLAHGVLSRSECARITLEKPRPRAPVKLLSPRPRVKWRHGKWSPTFALFWVQHRRGLLLLLGLSVVWSVLAGVWLIAYYPLVMFMFASIALPVSPAEPSKLETLHTWGVSPYQIERLRRQWILIAGGACTHCGFGARVLLNDNDLVAEVGLALTVWATCILIHASIPILLAPLVRMGLWLALMAYVLYEPARRPFEALVDSVVSLGPHGRLTLAVTLCLLAALALWKTHPKPTEGFSSAP